MSFDLILRDGTKEFGDVFFGAVDSRSPKTILDLRSILKIPENLELDLELLRRLNRERTSRQQNILKRAKRESVPIDTESG